MTKERLTADVILDLDGHARMVDHIKAQLAYAHVMVEFYEKALKSQEDIVKKLEEELKDNRLMRSNQ